MKYCVMCGSTIPDDQGSTTCSMCYGDPDPMKLFLAWTVLVVVVWTASVAWEQTNKSSQSLQKTVVSNLTIDAQIDYPIQENGKLDTFIGTLARRGLICQVIGHRWPCLEDSKVKAFFHPGISYRTCTICGKTESKTEGEWK